MAYPPDLAYTKDHEWVRIDDQRGRFGITEYAQEQLGDVVYVELPEVGTTLKQAESFGTVESVKAVSELYAPMSGRVTEVNTAVKTKPELLNSDPHSTWLIAVELTNPSERDGLLTADQYAALVK